MVVLGILLCLFGGLLIYWNIPYSPQKSAFIKKMNEKVSQTKQAEGVCTKAEIEKLPEAMQRYCAYVGLENAPKYNAIRVEFKDTKFVFDDNSGKMLDMDYDLWLLQEEWYRSAYCTSSMYGIPFEGQDYCTDDKQGGMKGTIAKAIQIFDVHDEDGYRAGLISWLIEGITLNPSTLLSPYITYEEIDNQHVKATICYNGVSGTGIITVNEEGALTEFYSDERQMEEIDGVKTQIGWRCEIEWNTPKEGVQQQPQVIRCIKKYPNKEVVYFDADDYTVTYLK